MERNEGNRASSNFDYEAHVWGGPCDLINIKEKRHSCLGLKRFLEVAREKKAKVLEVGCGTGIFLRSLKSYRPDLELSGCDISKKAISIAKDSAHSGIDFEVANAYALPYSGESFDYVVIMDVLEHLDYPAGAIKEVQRVLKKNGFFHLLVPCEANALTLHWLMWKIRLGHNLKRKYAGHIQRLTGGETHRLLKDCGFTVIKETYSFHFLGQIYDIFFDYLPRIFTKNKIALDRREQLSGIKNKITRSIRERGILLTFWFMLGRVVEILAFLESEILKYFPIAMGLHITSTKGETN
jgi:ubiquinone/menaquinone biosynthesis C-methylase UbiE